MSDQDWSLPFAVLAAVHHRTKAEILDMDEAEMNGYLQHTQTVLKMQSQAQAAALSSVILKLLHKM